MAHRFFIASEWLDPPTVHLHDDTAHQIRTVLRLQPGDEIMVLDNSGIEWQVRLISVSKDSVQGDIIAQKPAQGEPAVRLTLYQGTLKGQKFEWVLQKGTELGVSCFVPTVCERSVVRKPDDITKKYNRWQHIIREAAEQSGRGKLPQLEAVMPLAEAMAHAQANSLILVPCAKREAKGGNLKEILSEARIDRVALFIGPEGGFSIDEVRQAQEAGAKVVTLGPRILRAETAGVAVCAAILYELGDWR